MPQESLPNFLLVILVTNTDIIQKSYQFPTQCCEANRCDYLWNYNCSLWRKGPCQDIIYSGQCFQPG